MTEGLPPGAAAALLFRRQFVLGPRAFRTGVDWPARPIGPAVLSTHPDLEVHEGRGAERHVVLLGVFVDPHRPTLHPGALIDELAEGRPDLAEVARRTAGYTGRWALVYRARDAFAVLPDAFGARSVHYAVPTDGERWCASDPKLLEACAGLTTDASPDLAAFLESPEFLLQEGAWVGDGTRYRDCRRLMPGHLLDLRTGTVRRHFPAGAVARHSIETAAERAARILRGSLDALARLRPLRLAVTAGWDSRVLLSAARHHLDRIRCYVDRYGVLEPDHRDVAVPSALARELGFGFEVENSSLDPPDDFVDLLRASVGGARMLHRTRAIWAKLARGEERTVVNGNGGEVARSFFDPRERRPPPADVDRLLDVFGYRDSDYARDALSAWLASAPRDPDGVGLLDLLYWEQRMGNWGVLHAAEQDLAVDEVSPFNNRALLETLLGAPRAARLAPGFALHRHIVERLWPEALAVPVNPPAPRPRPIVSDELLRRLRNRKR